MTDPMESPQGVAVIGGGPAGLMAAEILIEAGQAVDLYEGMPSVGRKLLVAGSSGFNLTHSEPFDQFLSHYGEREDILRPFLTRFGPDELQKWVQELGIQIFTGSSGKVFPLEMKAASLLAAWRKRLSASGVQFHLNQQWLGWNDDGSLRFSTPDGDLVCRPPAMILALGGASWKKLGSDGSWIQILNERGVQSAPFKPSNCGFEVSWSEHFRQKYEGQPLKAVILHFTDSGKQSWQKQGEFIITTYGLEGSLIYALSAPIRDEIDKNGSAVIHLDLAPDRSLELLAERLSQPRGSKSISYHLEHKVGMRGLKAGLLWEFLPRFFFDDPQKLARAIKDLHITLLAPRPLDEAISSAGGLLFEELDEHLMLKKIPGVFCAGEMLDWEAPTGGYLVTACCATGRAAGQGALNWLHNQESKSL